METPTLIDVELIKPNPYQPRQAEDPAAVAEIADSIARNGLMQIPTARQVNGHYELAFGHTRLAAFKLLQEETMPLIVRELDDLQMFELGVSENIKRRDLNPIEQAESMRRYMQEFKKNSVETGEFFNVSPEKVRNAVRLLNLPTVLQSGVADGSITQNNARRLLTIQRVAPDEVVHVANKLKGDADPDRIISESLKDTGRSVEMWQRWQSGEPRAGNRLWRLNISADKFPSRQLPELRAADVAKSLDMELTAELRSRIEDYIETATKHPEFVSEFAEANPKYANLMERIAHLLNPPACSACPLYAKVDGSHFCTLKLCHSRKSRAWEENVIQTASKKLGVLVYEAKRDGKDFGYLSSYDEPDKKLVQEHNADLRLKKGTNWSQHFDGLPEGYSIVVIGDALKKLRKRHQANNHSHNSSNDAAYLAEQKRLREIRQANELAMYEFLWNVATPAFAVLLDGLINVDFIDTLAGRMARGVPAEEPDKKATKAVKLDFHRRSILFSLMDEDLNMWEIKQKKHPVTAMAKQLQGKATTWGVKLPKNWMDQAAEADKGITVSTETETA
jgi:ParB/RepB/Spo0J family partition protein